MRTLSLALTIVVLSTIAPAMAANERVVTDFSDGALLGQVRSTAQLRQDFAAHDALLAEASLDAGLTPEQYHRLRAAIAAGRERYVELPQHIDAMSGAHGDHVFAVHNVRIPQGVYGWEVDLREPHGIVKVYLPNRCGNVSVVRVHRAEVLAAAPVYNVEKSAYAPPAIAAAPSGFSPMPASYAAPQPAPAVAYVPTLSAPNFAGPAASRHFAFLPFLLGGIVAGFLASGGHGAGVTIGSHPGVPPVAVTPTPTPAPVSCPTAVRRRRPHV